MKRKVIQVGKFTKVISIPSKWAERNNINKGDELNIEENKYSLILKTLSSMDTLKETRVTLSPESFHKIILTNLYIDGYDEVVVNFDDSSVLSKIEENLDSLLGYEIINQSSRSCTIKNIASSKETDFDTILKRIFYILRDAIQNTLNNMDKGDMNSLHNMEKSDLLINKLCSLCERIINKNQERTNYEYYLVCQLEFISDHLKYFSNELKNIEKIDRILIRFYRTMSLCFGDFFNLFVKKEEDEDRKTKLEVKLREALVEFNKKRGSLKEVSGQKMIEHLCIIIGVLRHLNMRSSKNS